MLQLSCGFAFFINFEMQRVLCYLLHVRHSAESTSDVGSRTSLWRQAASTELRRFRPRCVPHQRHVP